MYNLQGKEEFEQYISEIVYDTVFGNERDKLIKFERDLVKTWYLAEQMPDAVASGVNANKKIDVIRNLVDDIEEGDLAPILDNIVERVAYHILPYIDVDKWEGE